MTRTVSEVSPALAETLEKLCDSNRRILKKLSALSSTVALSKKITQLKLLTFFKRSRVPQLTSESVSENKGVIPKTYVSADN